MMFDLFAALDTETTGLYPDRGDAVVEVASIVIRNGAPIDTFRRFYMPPGRLRPKVAELHGLNRRTVRKIRRQTGADYPEKWSQDWRSLVDWWRGHGVKVVAAHNIGFDANFFPDGALEDFRLLCTMRGLTDYCGIPAPVKEGDLDTDARKVKWPRLTEAYEEMKRRGDLRRIFPRSEMKGLKLHSALDDAKVAACLAWSMGRLGITGN